MTYSQYSLNEDQVQRFPSAANEDLLESNIFIEKIENIVLV